MEAAFCLGMSDRSCCFFGHREIEIMDELVTRLRAEIESLIQNGVTRFLFGSRSEFDALCHNVVTELKQTYPAIIRVAYDTKSESSILEEDREEAEKGFTKLFNRDIHLAGYEEVRKPDVVYVSGKASYIERNQVMIDDSDICIVYYDETYTPKQRQISHKSVGGIWTSPNSGTAIAYQYANRKGRQIINHYCPHGTNSTN